MRPQAVVGRRKRLPHHCRHTSCRGGACYSLPTLRHGPVTGAGAGGQLGTALHFDPNGVILSRLAATGGEADDVLAVHFTGDRLNRLFQGFLLDKPKGASAGGAGKLHGVVGLALLGEFAFLTHGVSLSGCVVSSSSCPI